MPAIFAASSEAFNDYKRKSIYLSSSLFFVRKIGDTQIKLEEDNGQLEALQLIADASLDLRQHLLNFLGAVDDARFEARAEPVVVLVVAVFGFVLARADAAHQTILHRLHLLTHRLFCLTDLRRALLHALIELEWIERRILRAPVRTVERITLHNENEVHKQRH